MAKGEKPGKEAKKKPAANKTKPAAKPKAQGGSKAPAKAKEPIKGATQSLDDDWGHDFMECLEELNPQQAHFVMEWVKTRNGVASYRAAYGAHLSYGTCGTSAHKLLKTAKIRACIRTISDSIVKRYNSDPEFILNELAKMAHVNLGDFIEIQDDGTAIPDLGLASRDMLAGIEEYHTEEVSEPTGVKGETPNTVRRTRIKLVSKRAVLMDLAKLQKMFSDNFSPRAETAQIIQDLEDGKLTLVEAGYRFTRLGLPLPEIIKIQLSRREEDEGDGPVVTPVTPADLDRLYREALASRDKQMEQFLPERQQQVLQIKHDLKSSESFAPTVGSVDGAPESF